jgi:hypothetical protein
MFYYGKNRDSVFLNQTSSFLLPFVISDPNTVLGPQWTNHSAEIRVTSDWKSTDYGMADSPNDYADGEVFLLSKTTTTDSPGYVLFDYEVEFAEMQISPRLLNLPIPRAQWSNVALTNATSRTINSEADFDTTLGVNLSGSTSSLPTGSTVGDIYKVIFDVTNSTFAVGTAANIVKFSTSPNYPFAQTLSDGMTIYGVHTANGSTFTLFETVSAAYAGVNPLTWGATLNFSFNLQIWISFVGTTSGAGIKPSY